MSKSEGLINKTLKTFSQISPFYTSFLSFSTQSKPSTCFAQYFLPPVEPSATVSKSLQDIPWSI